jgi:hypothetical protein
VPATSIYLPFNNEALENVIIPFKSKCLHPLQKDVFLNTSYSLLSKRKIGLAKDISTSFSKKTIDIREREIRKFLAKGGSFVPVGEIDKGDLFNIYNELFFARRNKEITDQALNKCFFNDFHSYFKGEVMFINDEPVAIQLILSVTSKVGLFADFINIGYKQSCNVNSIGTILMWNNLKVLHAESSRINKELYYSYGYMSGEYKKRWCNPVSIGRTLF